MESVRNFLTKFQHTAGDGTLSNIDGCFYAQNNPELFFRDGQRRIDFVLIYNKANPDEELVRKRNNFLLVLAEKHMEIEVEDSLGNIIAETKYKDSEDEEHELVDKPPPLASHQHGTTPHGNVKDFVAQSTSIGFDATEREAEMARHHEEKHKNDLIYVKLHASWKLMTSYAEILKFRKPLKKVDGFVRVEENAVDLFTVFKLKPEEVKPISFPFTCPYVANKPYLFHIDTDNRQDFFTQAERSYVVNYIMRRSSTKTSKNESHDSDESSNRGGLPPQQSIDVEYETGARPEDTELKEHQNDIDYGIAKLISRGVFVAAFPLHEAEKKRKTDSLINTRMMLSKHWASYKKAFKDQPIDYVRLYFGESVAFYFAWLGFYTKSLVPVTIIGAVIFAFGLLNLTGDPIVNDICNKGKDFLMCPKCNQKCKFWFLNESCSRVKLSRMLDHEGTVVFAIIMAIWATIFLEMWKRQQFRLAYRWNVHEIEPVDEPPRPEFIALLDENYPSTINVITKIPEPRIYFWRKKIPIFIFSYSIILFSILLCLGILIGVIFYRLVVISQLRLSSYSFVSANAGILTTITSAMINLVFIMLLQQIYVRAARYLTDIEKHRTQTEYDDALTFKLYCLQFVNFYSSLFYIALLQGPTSALPGSSSVPIQSTGCDSGDCLFELFIQLFITMVGKQTMNFFVENLNPVMIRLWNMRKFMNKESCHSGGDDVSVAGPWDLTSANADRRRWLSTIKMCTDDFALKDGGSSPLFDEYLEMMIQFGFITIFVAAFPLAPLFAMLNNIFELRQDAKKFLFHLRRPVATRVKNIGIWFDILTVLSKISIRSNALIIAFTTQFISRLVYENRYRPPQMDGLQGYVNFSMSYMEVSRFPSVKPPEESENLCRYMDFRNRPGSENPYEHSIQFWHILAARFIFIFIFENFVITLTSVVAEIVPDIPKKLSILMRRETNLLNDMILHVEMHKKGGGHGHGGIKLPTTGESSDANPLDKLIRSTKVYQEKDDLEPQFYEYVEGVARKVRQNAVKAFSNVLENASQKRI